MFPDELKAYPQWVMWRKVVKPDGEETKVPFSAHTNTFAATNDPTTWASYDVAVRAATISVADGIGFVLTENDPYAFIDLDNPCGNPEIIARHNKIIKTFDSYSELSPSQTGVHIICKGSVPNGKRRKVSQVEVYSSGRFMTMTGNTYKDIPIADRSFYLHILWEELGGKVNGDAEYIVQEQDERYDDPTIYHQARDAKNGDLFDKLWQGHWAEAGYASQSEADFALINILGFYSRNREQIKRLFYYSGLGQRPKAKRKAYLDTMIQRSFDNQPPMIDLKEVVSNAKKVLDTKVEARPNPFLGELFANVVDPDYDHTRPPGLLGDIAEYVFNSAIRPVKEMGLAAAIGLMAGICGRQYNVSNTGLNQYVLLLAGTGTGKEAVKSGIDKLMQAVRVQVPAAMDFIGPSQIASGQALIRHVSTHPCFLSIVGEFGIKLHSMCGQYANPAQESFRAQLLDLYNKSGEKDILQQMIYSDKEKNTKIVSSPAFSLLGESTPETYYSELDDSMIQQGLLPRFLCIEYFGKRVLENDKANLVQPSQALVTRVGEVAANCLLMAQSNRVLHVNLDAESTAFRRDVDVETTTHINRSELPIAKHLWNRAALKTLKLAALIAIGIDPYSPLIKIEHMRWAYDLVERDIKNVFVRFEKGQIGRSTNESNQVNDAIGVIREYLVRPFEGLRNYGVVETMQQSRVITWAYILNRLQQKGSFRHDKMGTKYAIARTIDTLVKDGAIKKMRDWDMKNHFNSGAEAYAITDVSRFVGSVQTQ